MLIPGTDGLHLPMPWDVYDDIDDAPGHANRVDVRIHSGRADEILGRPSTLCVVHGTDYQLRMTISALILDGWEPLTYLDPEDCQPRYGCIHVATFFGGHHTLGEQMAAFSVLVGIDGNDTLPWLHRTYRDH